LRCKLSDFSSILQTFVQFIHTRKNIEFLFHKID